MNTFVELVLIPISERKRKKLLGKLIKHTDYPEEPPRVSDFKWVISRLGLGETLNTPFLLQSALEIYPYLENLAKRNDDSSCTSDEEDKQSELSSWPLIEERKLTKTLKFVNQRFENAIRKANCEPSEPIRERIHRRAQEWALKLSNFSVDDETHQPDHNHDDQEDAILVSSSIMSETLNSSSRNKLAFTAKILKEFFFAQKLEQEIKESRNTEDLPSVASSCSTLNYKLLHSTDKPIMDFIGDAINDYEISANDLIRLITFSRVGESTRPLDNPSSTIQQIQKKSFTTAAANVITILNHLRYNFKGMDLRAISISGADLQDGDFDSTDFTGADLSGVNFNRAWLKNSNLTKTNLSEAIFGEWPVFTLNGDIGCIAH